MSTPLSPMNLPHITLLIAAFLNVALGVIIIAKDWRRPSHRFFSAFALSVALWSVALALFRATADPLFARAAIKGSYIAAALIGASFFAFAHTFPDRASLPRRHALLIAIPTLIITALLLIPDFLTRAIIAAPYGPAVRLGLPEYLLFTLFFLGFFGSGLYRIAKTITAAEGILRVQLRYIFWGVLLAGLPAITLNLILPSPFFENFRFIWLGPFFSLIIVAAVAVAIVEHHLLNIKVIVSEVFIALLILVVFLQTLVAPTVPSLLGQLATLAIAGLLGVLLIRSVLEEVRRREALHRANEALTRLDAARAELLSIVSHQLRTPLTGIRGYASLLKETATAKLTASERHQLDMLLVLSADMLQLINDLLNAARIEDGRMTYQFTTIDLVPLVAQIVEELHPQAALKQLELTADLPEQVPSVAADAEKLRQVFLNLVENAIKYTSQGSVGVYLAHRGGVVRFVVEDTGMGMHPEVLRHLFQKFTRAREAEASPFHGTGLGLYVAKNIVEAHHGRIWGESTGAGTGSRFTVELPVHHNHLDHTSDHIPPLSE